MTKKYKHAVIVGRFQPFHLGHYELFKRAAEVAENIICLIGSANKPADSANPFTWIDREALINFSLTEFNFPEDVTVDYCDLNDHIYNLNGWLAEVQEIVNDHKMRADDKDVILIGHRKEEDNESNSWYWFDQFPQWDKDISKNTIEVDGKEMSATLIRKAAYEYDDHAIDMLKSYISPSVYGFVFEEWCKNAGDHFLEMKACHEFHSDYPEQWGTGPHITVDAAVFCCGHVLLVKRKNHPGKGLYALPGGFLEPYEYISTGIIRELREETKIKVPVPVLHGAMVGEPKVFEYPKRSLRGRIITHCGLIHLRNDTALPEVRGADDAEKAEWVPISKVVDSFRSKMFEDHYDMFLHMKALIK